MTTRAAQPLPAQFATLLRLELTNWRWSWKAMMLLDILTPLAGMVALSVFGRDMGEETLRHVFAGNLVMAFAFGTMRKVCNHTAFLRMTGGMDFFASLPVGKAAFILAMMAAFLLLAVPAVATTLVVGALLLGVQLEVHPLFVVAIPVIALPLAALGAIVGLRVRPAETANAVVLALMLFLVGLGPVVIPPDRLAPWLHWTQWISPASYAASALRQTLFGPVTERLAIDLGVLGFAGLLLLGIVFRKIDWRSDED